MNLMELIEYLEDELTRGAAVPFTGKQLVDTEKCLDILGDLRDNLPESIERSENIVKESDHILFDARKQAEDIALQAEQSATSIIQDARREAARLVQETEIFQMAQDEAERILAQAQSEAQQIEQTAQRNAEAMREGSVEYAQDVMQILEQTVISHIDTMDDQLGLIRRNGQELQDMQ